MLRKFYCLFTLVLSFSFIGCTEFMHENKDNVKDNIEQPMIKEGYANPNGIFILNYSNPENGKGYVSYITPEGEFKKNVYKEVNGLELDGKAKSMYIQGDKLYILCDGKNDVLVVCDAVTLKKEKSFNMSDFNFDVPKGVNNTYGVGFRNPSRITVLDEHNIFIVDTQGMFRFDSVTGEMFLLEESYALGNSGKTIETCVSNKGVPVIDGKVYVSTGGFWKSTGILEFEKNSKTPTRSLDISTKFSQNSGLVKDENNNMWFAVFNRENKNKSELHRIETTGSKLSSSYSMVIKGNIDPGFNDTPGISLGNNFAYFCGQTTTISRCNMEVNKTSEYIDVASSVDVSSYINCNPIIDTMNKRLYVATYSGSEGDEEKSDLLIYDCSKDRPELLEIISGKTSFVSGIYIVSDFYR